MPDRVVSAFFFPRKRPAIYLLAGVALSLVVSAASLPPRTVWDGVFSATQVARGKKAYESLCRRCHGDTLGGGEDSPAMAGQDFLNAWYGKSVGELVEYTRETMPTDGAQITRRQSTDITAFILAFNDFPTGKAELAPEVEVLNQILITPKK
jgi:mono/diheme cytochrome c family protein